MTTDQRVETKRKPRGRFLSTASEILLATLLGASGLAGCGDELDATAWQLDEGTASADEPLYYRSTTLWDQRDIPVCWTSGGFANEKAWVKEAVRGQRSWSSFGDLNFTGWGGCAPGATGIRITPGSSMVTFFLGEGPGSVTAMELDFTASPQTRWTRCVDNSLNRRDCIATVALHEFGHAISVAHEQNRSDTPGSCTKPPQGTNGDTTYGPWDGHSIMNYCGGADELSGLDLTGIDYAYGARYGDAKRAGDFNGDGREDILCHDVANGDKWIDFADASGRFYGTDWSRASKWCYHDSAELYKGDFNGDGRTDLLCHDNNNGRKWIDYADASGRFYGTDWSRDGHWCQHGTGRLFVGDFNGDSRDDLLCHDVATGRKWIDYADASGRFNGTDWTRDARWCYHESARLFVGDFNGDGRDDLLCHDVATGRKWIDLADTAGRFYGTNWTRDAHWCYHSGASLFVGDFNGDSRDDILCHDVTTGTKWIDFANTAGQFLGTNWSRAAHWCNHSGARLSVGDFNGDSRDDILCHDVATGTKWIDFANTSGQFLGTDWSRAAHWCNHDAGELH